MTNSNTSHTHTQKILLTTLTLLFLTGLGAANVGSGDIGSITAPDVDQGTSVTQSVTIPVTDDSNGDTLTVSFADSNSASITGASVTSSEYSSNPSVDTTDFSGDTFDISIPSGQSTSQTDVTVEITLDTSSQSAGQLSYSVTSNNGGSGGADTTANFQVNQVLDTVEVSSPSKAISQGESLSVDLVNANDLAGDQFTGTAQVTFGTSSLSGDTTSDVTVNSVDFSSSNGNAGEAPGVSIYSSADTESLYDQSGTTVQVSTAQSSNTDSFSLTVNQVLSSFSVSDLSIDQGQALNMDFTGATDLAGQTYTQSGEGITVQTSTLTGISTDSSVTVDFSGSTNSQGVHNGVEILTSAQTKNLEAQTTSIAADSDSTSASGTSQVTVNQVADSITARTDGTATADGTDSVTFTVTVTDYTGNAVQGATVSVDDAQDVGSLSGISSGDTDNTDSNGEATFTATSTNSGDYTVQFSSSAGDLSSATTQATATFEPGATDHLEITTAPGASTAGSESGEFVVTRYDANNNPVTSGSLTVDLSTDSSGQNAEFRDSSSGSSTTTVTITGGSSTQNFYYYDEKASDHSLTVDVVDITSDSVTHTVSSANADSVSLTQDVTESQTAGQAISSSGGDPAVKVTDEYGNLVDSVSVSATLQGGTGSLTTDPTTVSTTNGVATFSSLVTETADTGYNLQFSIDSNNGNVVSSPSTSSVSTSTFEVEPASASQYSFSNVPISVEAGSEVSIDVTAQDTNGNTVTGYSGAATVSTDTGDDISGESVSFTEGTATFTTSSLKTKEGSQSLNFNDGEFSTSTSTFAVNSASPDELTFTSKPGNSITAGSSADYQVTVKDQYGNQVDSPGITVGLNVDGTEVTSQDFTSAQETISWSSIDSPSTETAGSYTVNATSSAVSTNTSDHTLTVNPAAPDTISAEDVSATAGEQGTITVTATDQYGNDATSGTVNVNSDSVSLSGISSSDSASVSEGTAEFTFNEQTANTDSGYTVDFQLGSSGDTASSTVTVEPASATKLVVTSSPLSLEAGNQGTITAEVQDTHGNAVSSGEYTLDLSTDSGKGEFRDGEGNTISQVSVVDGESQATFDYYDENAGSPTVTVSDSVTDGLTEATQTQAVNPASLDHYAFSSVPSQLATGESTTVTVTAEDQYDNTADYSGTADVETTGNSDISMTTSSFSSGTLDFTTSSLTTAVDEQSLKFTDTSDSSVSSTTSTFYVGDDAYSLTAGQWTALSAPYTTSSVDLQGSDGTVLSYDPSAEGDVKWTVVGEDEALQNPQEAYFVTGFDSIAMNKDSDSADTGVTVEEGWNFVGAYSNSASQQIQDVFSPFENAADTIGYPSRNLVTQSDGTNNNKFNGFQNFDGTSDVGTAVEGAYWFHVYDGPVTLTPPQPETN